MSVTSLKLPDELKKRIAALVAGSGRSAHAFMVEAIAREMERASGEPKRLVKGARSAWWEHRLLAYPKGNTLCITSCPAWLA
jgi:hypothetical protein